MARRRRDGQEAEESALSDEAQGLGPRLVAPVEVEKEAAGWQGEFAHARAITAMPSRMKPLELW